MNYFLRNRQFILVVALQVITVLLLLTVMHEKSTRKANVLGDKFYGLQKEDYERIDKILNDETTANNVIEQNIGHYHLKKQIKSSTIGLRLDGGLTPEILSMIQKWESLKEINGREIFTVVPLAVFTILVGVYPKVLNVFLKDTVDNLVKLILGS